MTDYEQVGLGCMPDIHPCIMALGVSSDNTHMAHTSNLLDIFLPALKRTLCNLQLSTLLPLNGSQPLSITMGVPETEAGQ